MKFKALLMASMAAATTVFADQANQCLTFSTAGTDLYADGQPVADNEFYALVWYAAPAVDVAFDAEGNAFGLDQSGNKVQSGSVKVVSIEPLAKGGRCPEYFLQISSTQAKGFAGGTFALVMLDTRNADGKPSAAKGGLFDATQGRVNGYAKIEANIQIGAQTGGPAGKAEVAAPEVAAIASLLPENIENPRITGIDVRNGKVFLTVTGTSAKLDYGVAAASTPEGLANAQPDKGAKAGNGEITLEVEIPAGQQGQFFKVGRKPLK